ncbi:MAG: rhodanese-like domain-containing protein [Saprospiraceae bacterium]|nr:rhodanese-like domain-containing protein [Saprospiraceae bacterium]
MKAITVQALKTMMAQGEDFQLIDVREKAEYEQFNLQGVSIPLGQLSQEVHRIERHKKVVIHCKSGARSQKAIQILMREFDFDNLYH